MDSLLTALLKQQLKKYQLRYAFKMLQTKNKTHPIYLSFRDQQAFASLPETSSLQNQSKEQYLKYMEEVLLTKEQELSELQQQLTRQKKKQELREATYSIVTPLTLTNQSQTLVKKIKLFKQIMLKYVTHCPQLTFDQDFQELINELQVVEQSCRHNYDQLKEQLLNNHQELSAQRQQLTEKLSKLQELESYQKYLTELQKILEEKENQLIQKQQQLRLSQNNNKGEAGKASITDSVDEQQYNTFQSQNTNNEHNGTALRTRTKIFQQRVSKKEQLSAHKESSKIMQEMQEENFPPPTQDNNTTASSHSTITQKELTTLATQTEPQIKPESPKLTSAGRVHGEYLHLKFVKLWLKFSGNKSKNSQHSVLMTLYRWRLNALYDQSLKESVNELIAWPVKPQKWNNLPIDKYAQLTLRKQKYLENFFDYERQKFHRQKIQSLLHSIFKNKNRKQRIAVFIYFKKYREISLISKIMTTNHFSNNPQGYPLKEVTTNHSQNTNLGLSGTNKQSRIASDSSVYIDEPSKRSSAKSRLSKNGPLQASQIKPKGKDKNVDMTRLKQYIKTQEETQVKLAMQCAKTQSVYRMALLLQGKTRLFQHEFLFSLFNYSENSKVNQLYHTVSNYEFKWELFMAKARLALTSNSNKVSHLQQLVSFINQDSK